MDLQSESFLDWPSMGSVVCVQSDTTFETHYSISDLAERWRLGRETVRLLIKDEPGVVRVRLGRRKAMTRYSVPESVARRVHTRLFNPVV